MGSNLRSAEWHIKPRYSVRFNLEYTLMNLQRWLGRSSYFIGWPWKDSTNRYSTTLAGFQWKRELPRATYCVYKQIFQPPGSNPLQLLIRDTLGKQCKNTEMRSYNGASNVVPNSGRVVPNIKRAHEIRIWSPRSGLRLKSPGLDISRGVGVLCDPSCFKSRL